MFRVLLTGIHLMRTGEVEANLVRLNEFHKLPYIVDLIARKVQGAESLTLADSDLRFYEAEYERLVLKLQEAWAESSLPEAPTARGALNDLLVRLRVDGLRRTR